MLNIVSYIKKHGFDKAVSDFKLKVSAAGNLISLNYNQIESPKTPETNECRGLILERETYNVVCYPFYRFFNHGESCAENIDFTNAEAECKIDGSILNCFFSEGSWRVATRGTTDASGSVNDNGFSFAELFWKTLPQEFNGFLEKADKRTTFIFELVSPYNRIVTRYEYPDLYLLGGRYMDTLEEMDVLEVDIIAGNWNLKRPKTFKCCSLENVVDKFRHMHPTDEGFVVVDRTRKVNGNYPRVKVKNPAYVELHHSVGAGGSGYMSHKTIIELWKLGETAEIKAYYPEYAAKIESVEGKLAALEQQASAAYTSLSNESLTQKEFALRIKDLPYKHILFALRGNKTDSAKNYLLSSRTESLIELMNVEDGDQC